MPTLTLTHAQVIELVSQLSADQQAALLQSLLTKQWSTWIELSQYGAERVQRAAGQRGRDWDAMTEDEREAFLDDVVHENRQCSG
jgi:hypothetical protein